MPGSPQVSGPPLARSRAEFDVREYGAVHRDTSGLSLPLACEAARADMLVYLAQNPTCGATMLLPAGRWFTAYPIIFDLDYGTFAGEGADITTLESVGGGGFPPLVIGMNRTPNGVTLTPDHWVDLYGKLDYATAPGQYYGVRTKTDAHVAFWASPWSYTGCATDGSDAYWAGVRQATIDFCVDWNGVNPPSIGNCNMFGMWDSVRPCPWSMILDGGINYYLQFVLSDGLTRNAHFTIPGTISPSGVHRVSFQIDTIGGTVQAYIGDTNANRKQVAVTLSATAFGPTTNLPFLANEIYPFLIGGLSNEASDAGPNPKADRSFYGLQISRGLLYANNGVGTAQTRIDGTAVSDTNCFNSGANSTIVRLQDTKGPNGPYGGRLVRWQAGPGSGYAGFGFGWFVSSNIQINTNWNIYSQNVRDCTLKTSPPPCPWGQGLTIAGAFNVRIVNVNAFGGSHGIGSLNLGATYPIDIHMCKGQGYDCSFHLLNQIFHISNLDCGYAGTAAIRLMGTGSIKDIFINDQEHRGRGTIHWYSSQDPRQLLIEGVTIDNEGWPFPTQATIIAESGYFYGSSLIVRNVIPGIVGAPGASVVALVDNAFPPYGTSDIVRLSAVIENISPVGQNYHSIVAVDGPLWKGQVRGQLVKTGDPPLISAPSGVTPGVVVVPFP